jgi:polyisoprenoid-binding protein YceI
LINLYTFALTIFNLNKQFKKKTKKMKKIVYSIMAVASLSMVSCGEATTEGTEAKADSIVAPSNDGTYALVEGSTIVWKAKHNNDADYVHVGKLNVSGSVVIAGDVLTAGTFTFDMASIDKDGEDEMATKLEGHLKAADFFAADSIPTATFNVTASTATSVTGDLTVLGITKSIEIPITPSIEGEVMTVAGTIIVNFLDFSVQYLVAGAALPEAEKATAATPEALIEFNLTFNKQAAVVAAK